MIKISEFNKIIVANWKLNGSIEFIDDYFDKLNSYSINSQVCAVICPPSIFLDKCYQKSENIYLGAQDCSIYELGSFTGEISASMLKQNNCDLCIVGHSERRQKFEETSEEIKIKAYNLINNNLNPIICIGESLEEKKKGIQKKVLSEQIIEIFPNNSSPENVILAYEPIWAIGTGIIPTLDEINEIHYFLKNEINHFKNYKILYGGSVSPKNAKDIMNLDSVDGVLVGGASLNPIDFIKILKD
jgi:triosephosphate isomerase (TIM)